MCSDVVTHSVHLALAILTLPLFLEHMTPLLELNFVTNCLLSILLVSAQLNFGRKGFLGPLGFASLGPVVT